MTGGDLVFPDTATVEVERTDHPLTGILVQYKVTFPNGYTGSVVQGRYTYGGPQGLWELAVVRDGEVVYDTPITDDVLGWLTESQVIEVLRAIEAL